MPISALDSRPLIGLSFWPVIWRGAEASKLRWMASSEIATGAITYDGRSKGFNGGSGGNFATICLALLPAGKNWSSAHKRGDEKAGDDDKRAEQPCESRASVRTAAAAP